jgi:uncharacterized tellurite resistance protein B-like protein
MESQQKKKQLMKILVGAAWIDGIIQPEEREYLRRQANANGIAADLEIQSLLSELVPVKPQQCYEWLAEYLGENPAEADYQELLEAISALIYSDSDVQTTEAQLLTKVQLLDPAAESPHSGLEKLLWGIQKLYRQAIGQEV